jgi:hypothetical protein
VGRLQHREGSQRLLPNVRQRAALGRGCEIRCHRRRGVVCRFLTGYLPTTLEFGSTIGVCFSNSIGLSRLTLRKPRCLLSALFRWPGRPRASSTYALSGRLVDLLEQDKVDIGKSEEDVKRKEQCVAHYNSI